MRDSGSELKNKLRVSARVSKSWGSSPFPTCLSATSYDEVQFALFRQVVWRKGVARSAKGQVRGSGKVIIILVMISIVIIFFTVK